MNESTIKVRTGVKAGGGTAQHSESAVLRVRTAVKAAGIWENHAQAQALRVRTGVTGGLWADNHSESAVLRVRSTVKAGGANLNHGESAVLRLRTDRRGSWGRSFTRARFPQLAQGLRPTRISTCTRSGTPAAVIDHAEDDHLMKSDQQLAHARA